MKLARINLLRGAEIGTSRSESSLERLPNELGDRLLLVVRHDVDDEQDKASCGALSAARRGRSRSSLVPATTPAAQED